MYKKLPFFTVAFLLVIQSFSQSDFKLKSSAFKIDCFPDVYGGNNEMKRFLRDNLVYPIEDLKSAKAGTVILGFIITKSGKAINIRVVRTVSNAIDKEAVRLLKLIEWIPAYKNGEPVNVDYALKIRFSISKHKKQVKERGFEYSLFTDLPIDTSFNIYETAERPPLFNNAQKTLPQFVDANMEYPESAVRHNIEGAVKLTFVVEPNGQTSNIKIIDGGLGGDCNNEAIRIAALTKWLPAIRNKCYVRYRMYYTMNFLLRRNNRLKSNISEYSTGE